MLDQRAGRFSGWPSDRALRNTSTNLRSPYCIALRSRQARHAFGGSTGSTYGLSHPFHGGPTRCRKEASEVKPLTTLRPSRPKGKAHMRIHLASVTVSATHNGRLLEMRAQPAIDQSDTAPSANTIEARRTRAISRPDVRLQPILLANTFPLASWRCPCKRFFNRPSQDTIRSDVRGKRCGLAGRNRAEEACPPRNQAGLKLRPHPVSQQ